MFNAPEILLAKRVLESKPTKKESCQSQWIFRIQSLLEEPPGEGRHIKRRYAPLDSKQSKTFPI